MRRSAGERSRRLRTAAFLALGASLAARGAAVAAAASAANPPAAIPPGASATRGGPATPAAPADTPSFSDEIGVSWVLVPVLVRSRNGYLDGLRRDDFHLSVDGRPVRFKDFERRGEAAVSLVFLQDLSGSMAIGGRLEASQQAVSYFLDQAQPGDEFAIASFAGTSTNVDVPYTEDLATLREAVASWEGYGRTALHDAVAWLPEITLSGRSVKRAAVLISDGVDNASTMTAAEARDLVRRAELPVYVIGLESGDPYEVDAAGKKLYRYADVLNLLAYMTGGRYFSVRGPEDLKEVCATIEEELHRQYILGFETVANGHSKFREIDVKVDNSKAIRVLTRRGYEGLPPAE
ncbi:MAG: VWA domain-containing protein [Thermoanaerobaculia bacterium]